ncbi:MAG: Hpt domain-containing protein [Nitrospirae bacterium]|nr:Hpt domain-containing protein [Nitrospirota bacterium]
MNNLFGNQANGNGFCSGEQLHPHSGIPVIDDSYLNEIAELQQDKEPNLVGHIIGIFLENTPVSLQNLRHAFVRGNMESVRKIAHCLKSSSGNIGAMSMSHASKSLEQLEPYSNEDAARLIVRIESEFDLVRSVLQNKIR